MMKLFGTALVTTGLFFTLTATGLVAEQQAKTATQITVPENYQNRFVRYSTVDQIGPKKVRFLYVNPEALRDAKPGQPAPYGTTIVMEDHRVELDGEGNPVLDSHGRLIPTDEIIAIIMQQKEKGWGADQADGDTLNVDWGYGIFTAEGIARAGIKYQSCHACHNRVAPQDYNFSFASFLERFKGE
ncbi:cytochrome P460 family protein [Kordiimonas sp. SCSIO 12610]|uniref:cytochrome P460 family protein n=1 Tax=Kordiimonas sp. SCSIO 12610 TaxID=2829597 RepID=UPI002108869B|nr:cytochrome P460 family protein [Kordiimonas sp. SCSIO 12610]UTW56608.1 cytochrome P460 family protein [Kordiimonas sp. SCSIO 12610]